MAFVDKVELLTLVVLHLLVTDPGHQRRGAGALLVEWGTRKADVAQLPSYLEASRPGRPLYARLGFNAAYEREFDLARYGGEGTDSNTVMIRDPVPQKDAAAES